MSDLDLEELKRLVAEATPSPLAVVGVAVSVLADIKLVNALPELIARVERAEKERDQLQRAISDACKYMDDAGFA